ncbi:hypothetical protein [Desulfovibrio sp. UCD-KL4C]|uniref:hypothetical protein n=1 Tax=Desulfovibrio sp. UCD-KL4C TaxID=2578120 RepID=UPI0025BFBB28|nr:hypothetical protein [Desulfovibrio sp. UCD-KL4C]
MKKITVLFTVLLMLAASSAFAIDAVFPTALNGTAAIDSKQTTSVTQVYKAETAKTNRVFIGFTVNASRSAFNGKTGENATFIPFNASHVNILSATDVSSAAQHDGNSTLSANFGFFNSTSAILPAVIAQNNGTDGGGAGQNATFIRANSVTFGVPGTATSAVLTKLPGLVTIGQFNSTAAVAAGHGAPTGMNPFLGIHTGSYDLVAALSNSTITTLSENAAGDSARNNADNLGTSFMMSYVNGTVVDAVYDSARWDYYAVGYDYDLHKSIYIIGQVYLDTAPTTTAIQQASNARAKFVVYNDDRTVTKGNDFTAKTYAYNATTVQAADGTIKITRTNSGYDLMQYGIMNKDRNMISGLTYNAKVGATNQPVRFFAVMIKNGQYLSSRDFANRGYKAIYSGFGGEGQRSNNATQGIMSLSADANLNVDTFIARNDADGVLTASTELFGEQQQTITDASITLGKTNVFKANSQSNMTLVNTDGKTPLANFYGKFAENKAYAVGIYQPIIAKVKNGFALSVMIPDSALVSPVDVAPKDYQFNGTIASTTTPAGQQRFVRNSTDYSNKALRKAWPAISSDFVPLTGAIGFNSTLHPANADQIKNGKFYQTFRVNFTGVAGRVDTLALYKLMANSHSAHRLTYASSETEGMNYDGAWWISDSDGDGYKGLTSALVASNNYYLNYTLKDNGNYDFVRGNSKGQFGDPIVLGSISPSSSSSSGCVFNPAASFGLEWLLLMLAPMVAIVRSRFKK